MSTKKELQDRYDERDKEFMEFDVAFKNTSRIVVEVEELTNLYADTAGERYKSYFHDKLLKSVGSLIKLKEYFRKKRETALRNRYKAELTLKHTKIPDGD